MLPELNEGFVIRRAVAGAPLAIGMRVRVEAVLDASADGRFAGQFGVVVGYVYDAPRDQYPHLPMVVVLVDRLGEEVFFASELRAAQGARPTLRATATQLS